MTAKKAVKPPSQAQARKLLAEEFRQALLVPVKISKQPRASRIGDSIDVEAEIGPTVTVRALVDTGCTTSAVSPGLLGKVGYKRIPQRIKKWVTSVIGSLPIRGVASVFLEAEGGPELPMQIAVLDLRRLTAGGKDFQMLLGLDYLRAAMAKIDVAWGKIEFGCKMMPLRPVQRETLPAPAQALPGRMVEPSRRISVDRISVEMSIEEVRALEKLVTRFRVAQIMETLPVPVLETPADPPSADDREGGNGSP